MSNNTDPKIKEIIERHASIMPEWHYNGNEIVLLSNLNRGIGGFLDDADNVFASNAPWDIAYLLSEIERLQTLAESDKDKISNAYCKAIDYEGYEWQGKENITAFRIGVRTVCDILGIEIKNV